MIFSIAFLQPPHNITKSNDSWILLMDAMVPHTFRWPQTPLDSTWKLLKRINMLDLNTRETKPCLWLRAVTYDVSDWIAAVRSPRVISVSLNSVTPGQCLVINLTVCQLELNRKQKWANVFEFFLPLLRWLQWNIHLLPDHIIIITIGIYDVFASPWGFSFIWWPVTLFWKQMFFPL